MLERNNALDFTKGMLVVGMLVYHVAVFFVSDVPTRNLITGILFDFVSGSWVFISGLIVVLHYNKKFQSERSETAKRLWIRGVKIILIFMILNLAIAWLELSDIRRIYDLQSIIEIFTHGNGILTSFEILIGIGYVLILSPLFLFLRFYGMLISVIIVIASSIYVSTGHQLAPNLWIILCGIGGMVAAYLIRSVSPEAFSPILRKQVVLFTAAFSVTICYYLLRVYGGFGKGDIFVYLMGVAGIIATIYTSYRWLQRFEPLDWILRFIGQYSLVSYISQMAIIWLWNKIYDSMGFNWFYIVNLLFVSSFMVIFILLLDYMRKQSRTIRGLYKFVFG